MAKTMYVSSTKGNNSYNGSLSQPFKTIQYAINSASAGDIIYVQNGSYNERIQLNKSGTSDKPIKLAAYSNHRPVINGAGIKWVGNGNWGGLINFNRQSHWLFEGIHLENSYGMGFGDDYGEPSTVGARNLQIKNCTVTKAGGSGFFVEFAEDILIDNLIAKETNKNLGQEGISLLNVNRFEIKNCQVLDCYKEGIDVKDGCKNGTIHDCYVNNTVRVGIYVDAFSRESFNIQVYDNIVTVPNGAGFSTGAEAGGRLENILFRNNIVYDSLRGYNISSNNSETNLQYTMKNITVQNNIAFNSGFTGIFIVAKVENLLIENNILYPSKSNLSNGIHVYDLKMFDANTAIIRNNLLAAINTNKNIIRGSDYIVEAKYDSVMIDPTGSLTGTRNFGLTKNSVARNAGYKGVDIGLNLESSPNPPEENYEPQEVKMISDINLFNGANSIKDFSPFQIRYTTVTAEKAMNDSNLPIQAEGVLITYYISQNIGGCYQEYQGIGTDERWIRFALSESSWTNWSKR